MVSVLQNISLAPPNLASTERAHPPQTHFHHQVHSVPSRQLSIKYRVIRYMAQYPETMQQKVIIPNKYGEKLVGMLHNTGSMEIAVLCHGFRNTKETVKDLATALDSEGISAFRFDFAGNGESEGTFQYGNYQREVEDLRAVIDHFTGAGRVVGAILGFSKGANIVLLYASKYHDIGTVVNLSARYKLDRGVKARLGEDFLERIEKDGYIDVKNKAGEVEYRVTEESLMERLNTSMHEACLQIDEKCRVLTVYGSSDHKPVEDAFEFSNIIKNHKLHIIEGSYSLDQHELTAVVVPFIKEGLQYHRDTFETGDQSSCEV